MDGIGCGDLIIPEIWCYFYVNAPIYFFILLENSSSYTRFTGGKVEYIIYALNIIGAIGNLQYPAAAIETIKSEIKSTKSNTVIILDTFYDAYKTAIKNVDNIILVSPSLSLPLIKKIPYKLKSKNVKESGAIYFNKLQTKQEIKNHKFVKNATALMLHSGGTTGIPKIVELTNENINSIAAQYSVNGMEYNRGENFMHTIPPFHAFGFSVGVHTPLCLGLELYASVKFDIDFLKKYFCNNKPNHFISSGSIIKSVLQDIDFDMKFLKNIAIGGTSLPSKDINYINQFLKDHGSSAILATGYGMSELCATVCTERNNCYKIGSIGVPLPLVNVKVISIDDGTMLKFNQTGELCFNSPSIMKGYYDCELDTDTIIDIDNDGVKWLHTGDIGTVDEKGFVFITGRIKRMATTMLEGGTLFKLFPDYIENVIKSMDIILDCAVTCIKHPNKIYVAIAFVVSSDKNHESLKGKIENQCRKLLPIYSQPYDIVQIDKIPRNTLGKVEYRVLEQQYTLSLDIT